MAADGRTKAQTLFEELGTEILKALESTPEYGSIGFTVHLVEGQLTRVEWSVSNHRKLSSKGGRI